MAATVSDRVIEASLLGLEMGTDLFIGDSPNALQSASTG
jgi:hypothetical protein